MADLTYKESHYALAPAEETKINVAVINGIVEAFVPSVQAIVEAFKQRTGSVTRWEVFFAGSVEFDGSTIVAEKSYYVASPAVGQFVQSGKWKTGDLCWAPYSDGFFYPAVYVRETSQEFSTIQYDKLGETASVYTDDLLKHYGETFALLTSRSSSKFIVEVPISGSIETFIDTCTALAGDSMNFQFLEPYITTNQALLDELDPKEKTPAGITFDVRRKVDPNFCRVGDLYYIPMQYYFYEDFCVICQNKDMDKADPRWHTTEQCANFGRCLMCRDSSHTPANCPRIEKRCHWCDGINHLSKDCTSLPICWHCGLRGHTHKFCWLWRLTPKKAKEHANSLNPSVWFVRPVNLTVQERIIWNIMKRNRREWYAEFVAKKKDHQ